MFIREKERKNGINSLNIRASIANRLATYEKAKAMSSEQTSGQNKSVKFKEAKPSISLTNDEGEELNGVDDSK